MRPIRGRLRLSALMPMALVALMAIGGCDKSPIVETRVVNVNVPQSCAHDPTALDLSQAYGIFRPGGDYDATQIAPPSLFLQGTSQAPNVGLPLVFPPTTQSLVVNVTDGGPGDAWNGMSFVGSSGPVNVLAWPAHGACNLSADLKQRNLSSQIGQAIGASIANLDGRHVLVAGGQEAGTHPPSFIVDLATGLATQLKTNIAHINPTITPTPGGGAIVAGGTSSTNEPINIADVYVPAADGSAGDFLGPKGQIVLYSARAGHGAVQLVTGETLLVGGVVDSNGTLTTSMEIVDSVAQQSTLTGPTLQVARKNPVVLRLASGEILVAGGTAPVTALTGNTVNDVPVSALEWFPANIASCPACDQAKGLQNLVATTQRDFVALSAGGALAVMAPDLTSPSDLKNVWLISGDGVLSPATTIPNLRGPVRLFPGVQGAPMLWTGLETTSSAASAPLGRWMRYAPWSAAFVDIADVLVGSHDGDRPLGSPSPTHFTIGPTDPQYGTDEPITSTDNGIALWLQNDGDTQQGGAGMHLWGYRFGTNNAYSAVPTLLTIDPPGNTDFLAPDQVPGDEIQFDPNKGLVMDTLATAFITDATFASFVADFHSPSGSAPYLVIRAVAGDPGCAGAVGCYAELEVGGVECAQLTGEHIVVERSGEVVMVSIDGSPFTQCHQNLNGSATASTIPSSARVSIGLRGSPSPSAGTSSAYDFTVTRTGP